MELYFHLKFLMVIISQILFTIKISDDLWDENHYDDLQCCAINYEA